VFNGIGATIDCGTGLEAGLGCNPGLEGGVIGWGCNLVVSPPNPVRV